MFSKTKQHLRLRQRQVNNEHIVSQGVKQNKARKIIKMETSLQQAERLEVLSKTKQDLRLIYSDN